MEDSQDIKIDINTPISQVMVKDLSGISYTAFGVITADKVFIPLEAYRHEGVLLDIVDAIKSWAADNKMLLNSMQAYKLASSIINSVRKTLG